MEKNDRKETPPRLFPSTGAGVLPALVLAVLAAAALPAAALAAAALAAAALAAAVPASAGTLSGDSLARQVARRYGVGGFAKVRELGYTFNVRYKGKTTERKWKWFPKTDSVCYQGPDQGGLSVTMDYSRKNPYSMGAENVKAVDRMFVNDQYWLLFPFHLVWDRDLRFSAGPAAGSGHDSTAGKGEVFRLTVAYPSQGGYTPGDAYDLYTDSAGTILRWIFRKTNADTASREAMWSKPVEVGGISLSLERPAPPRPNGTREDFKVWFTGVLAQPRSAP